MGDGVELGKTESFLGIRPGDVLTFIGGGGKSTLMAAIGARLVKEGRKVLHAATRPFPFEPGESPRVFYTDERPLGDLLPNLAEHGHMTIAPVRMEDGRLAGYDPKEVETYSDLADYLFVEAEDGGGSSLPAPADAPRPVPPATTVLGTIAGLDALGPDLDCEGFAERLCHAGGPLRCRPEIKRRVLLLNKADRHSIRLDGARVAKAVAEILGPDATPKVLITSVGDFRVPLS